MSLIAARQRGQVSVCKFTQCPSCKDVLCRSLEYRDIQMDLLETRTRTLLWNRPFSLLRQKRQERLPLWCMLICRVGIRMPCQPLLNEFVRHVVIQAGTFVDSTWQIPLLPAKVVVSTKGSTFIFVGEFGQCAGLSVFGEFQCLLSPGETPAIPHGLLCLNSL